MAGPAYLGCPDTVVEVRRLDRFKQDGPVSPPQLEGYFRLSGVVSGQYTRTYNSWGPFEVVLGGGAFCQDVISRAEPGWWEVRFLRGNELSYTGIIYEITQVAGQEGAVITGGDMASIFFDDGGQLINLENMQYANVDPVNIAYDVITKTFARLTPPDPYLMQNYLYRNPVDETIDFAPGLTAEYVGDLLDDLTDFGLLYAAVGRRIILAQPASLANTAVATLTTSHFAGNVSVIKSALGMGIMGVAVGEDDDGDTVVTTVGATGSPWGSPAIRVDVPKGVSARSRETAARRAIQGRQRPLYRVEMPSNARLYPSAPIDLPRLRPGSARIDVEIHNVPIPMRQPTMLTEVEFSFGQRGTGEEVKATFAPIGDPVPIP